LGELIFSPRWVLDDVTESLQCHQTSVRSSHGHTIDTAYLRETEQGLLRREVFRVDTPFSNEEIKGLAFFTDFTMRYLFRIML
jgi:hypothetical protein